MGTAVQLCGGSLSFSIVHERLGHVGTASEIYIACQGFIYGLRTCSSSRRVLRFDWSETGGRGFKET